MRSEDAVAHVSERRFSFAALALLILAGLCLFAGNILLWINSTLLNTGQFTAAVDRTMDDPDVQQRVATVLVAEAVQAGDLQDRIETRLPPDLAFLAPAASRELESALTGVAVRLLQTDFAGEVESTVASQLHERVLAVLRDDDAILRAQGDEIVIELPELLGRVFDRLGIQRPASLEDTGRGRIVLLDDTTGLKQASFFVSNSGTIAWVTILAALVLFIGAGLLIRPRGWRPGLTGSGATLVVVGFLTLLLLLGINLLLESSAEERTVARELVHQLERNLRLQSLGLVLLGGIFLVLGSTRLLHSFQTAEQRGVRLVKDFGVTNALLAVGVLAVVLYMI